ncbi:NAD(P)-binding domain-containing protein [Defluviimonas sp. WL0002]|uniref:NAD(P)-binding domain-containing protein n=1 Tax=Albidovulum marisflavi TaxID=2984159 RepID=A0ABT2ZA80_9RHOB|nr:NAD(P)-binding domain-containing protein [Defluviimonas sp. WL0002]MCV2868055.1 NAD(P)-binding domain-containing protein [Defluviimonas sp. WL0002]
MTGKVGVAGSSRLAVPALRLLRDARFEATGFASGGGQTAQDATEFAKGLGTLIVMAADVAETEALLFDTDALVTRAPALETLIICATLTPRYIRALRHRIPHRIAVIDAPALGSFRQAAEGRLTFLVGGAVEAVEGAKPVLAALGQKVERMGSLGAGTSAKVLRDFLSASGSAMTRLALDWAEAQGLDEPKLLDMLQASPARPLVAAECDMSEFGMDTPASDETVMSLIRDVEGALDAALSDAHLTPPAALRDAFRHLRGRALH